jgi:HAD superfamily hydrolase (TIGR01509 family)
MLRCVMLDWGGTLTEEGALMKKISKEFAFPFWKEQGFKGAFAEYSALEEETGKELWDTWRRTKTTRKEDWSLIFARKAGLRISEETARKEFETFREGYKKNSKLFPGVIKTLEMLKGERLLVALVSNNWKDMYELFDAYGIRKYFDATVVSEEVGALKSDLKPFEHVIAKLGVLPEECIMVGDNPEEDGACRKLGIKFCLIDVGGAHANETGGFDYRITEISGLEKIIKAEMKEV